MSVAVRKPFSVGLTVLCAVVGLLAFTTAPALAAGPPESPLTTAPVEVKGSTAVLEGVVNPLKIATTSWFFEYRAGAACTGGSTTPMEGPEETEARPVEVRVEGLTQDTKYTVCLVAENEAGEKTVGAPETFTTITPEPPETVDATPIEATEATLHGVLNPKHAGEAGTYEFVYQQSASECQGGEEKRAPEPAEGALGAKGEAKEVPITGLLPGMPYTFCLIAKNTAEEAALGKPVTFTTLAVAPTFTSESVSGVEATAATLEAEIDPGGAPTTYHFEYLTEAQFNAGGKTFTGATTTPQSASIGADDTAHSARARIAGLQTGTTYHYRVIANNVKSPAGGTPGPDKILTTSPAPGSAPSQSCTNEPRRAEQPFGSTLPDCRAYEMVSPTNTNGNDATGFNAEASARASEAPEGTEPAIVYSSKGSFEGPEGALLENQYLSRRTPNGWTTQDTTPPFTAAATEEPNSTYPTTYFTPELTAGLAVTSAQLAEAPPRGEGFGVYLAQFADHSYRYVGHTAAKEVPWGASADLGRVVLTDFSSGSLIESLNNGMEDVPVSITNTGGTMAAGAGSPAHTNEFAIYKDAWHSTSEDGTRVYFTTPAYLQENGGQAVGQLYVRVNIGAKVEPEPEREQSELGPKEECTEPAKACTIEVSAPAPGVSDPNGPRSARYWGASANGEKVFFTSKAELTADANTGDPESCAAAPEPSEQQGDCDADLYEYNLETGILTDLTVDAEPAGAAVQGVVQISKEGQYVYFVAKGALAAGASEQQCREETEEEKNGGAPKQPNLYCNLYVSDEGRAPVFIAKLTTTDHTDWLNEGIEEAGPQVNTAVVTPSGAQLAFISERTLPTANFPAGYDNEQAAAGDCQTTLEDHEAESGMCREVYLYNTETQSLMCASCNPSGARPVGPSSLPGVNLVYNASADYRPRDLLADGMLFFNSKDALAQHASGGIKNVYEYANGAVHAISNVAGGYESFFLDASPNGANVFFASADKLLPEDPGGNTVVWDAREGGGFPVVTSPASCDNADSCKPPESAQPSVFAPAGSATFNGLGNVPPPTTTAVTPKKKTVTELKAEKLAKALKLCAKDKQKSKRAKCQKQARQKYGVKKSANKASNKRRGK